MRLHRLPRRLDGENGPRAVKRERLRDEIVLAADAADDLAVFETVGNRSPIKVAIIALLTKRPSTRARRFAASSP